MLETVYFPAKMFFQGQLTSNNFDIKLFFTETPGKHTGQVSTENGTQSTAKQPTAMHVHAAEEGPALQCVSSAHAPCV